MSWKKVTELFSWYKGGLRRRLLWTGLLFLAIALLTNTVAGYLYSRAQIKKGAGKLQAEIASRVANEIAEFVDRKVERLFDLSGPASLYELGSGAQRHLALLLLRNDKAFTEVSVLSEKGIEVLKLSEKRVFLPRDLSDQSQSEKFKRAIAGVSYVSSVYTSDKAEPYVTVAVPISITPRQVVGVVTAELNLKSLWQIIVDIGFGQAGYAYLVDSRGNLIAHRDLSEVLKGRSLSHLSTVKRFLQNPSSLDSKPGEEARGLDDQLVLSTYGPIPQVRWAVILEEPLAAALAELRKMERYAFVFLGLGLLVGALIIVWVSNRITKPILELHKGAEIIGGGNLDHRVKVRTGDEIERLADRFNLMACELKNWYTTLEERVRQRTKELSALNRDLQEANRVKSEFLAAMSHELRTPLNVIMGNIDLLKDNYFGEINERQKESLNKVCRYSKMLLKLINQVLTLTKVEAKKMTLDVSTFPLDEIIAQTQTYVEQLNRDNRLQVLWEVEPDLPPLTTDEMKLEEILQNLIGNAFKFTLEGRIEVRVRDLEGGGRVEFAVADTGIGMEKSDLGKIFDQFHQLKEAHTGNYDGVGLGLSIVKRYLDLMQGEIRVESQTGKGSTFTFTLPYAPLAASEPPNFPAARKLESQEEKTNVSRPVRRT